MMVRVNMRLASRITLPLIPSHRGRETSWCGMDDEMRVRSHVNKAVASKYGVPGLKAALDMLGYFGGEPRSPLAPLGDREREDLKSILKTAGLLV